MTIKTSRHQRDNGIDICSNCGSDQISCTNSRSRDYGRYRNKRCVACGYRFATVEILAADMEALEKRVRLDLVEKLRDVLL